MKSIVFTELKVTFEDRVATVTGSFENDGYDDSEIKGMAAAIIKQLTNKGDMYGDPQIENIVIQGNAINGSDRS